MPQRKRPIGRAPKDEDESTDNPGEPSGLQGEQDEGLAGGSTKGGLSRGAGGGLQGRQQNRSTLGRQQNRSTLRPDREAAEFRRLRKESAGAGGGNEDVGDPGEYASPEEDRA